MSIISSQSYFQLANDTDPESGIGYAALPAELLTAEQTVARQDQAQAWSLNKKLCRSLLEEFTLTELRWSLPEKFHALYQQQVQRINNLINQQTDSYFAFANDPFRKDLAILRHRLIPCGAEFALPYSGISRRLLFKGGWRQAGKFIRAIAASGGSSPFLELHMHPHCTSEFNPQGWLETYENLADFLTLNPSFRGVQSTSWFLDPALGEKSPHLAYLRQVPEHCGAAILYAGEDDANSSGAFATSQTRRDLHKAGRYHPRLYTRIWPRQKLLQRGWREPGEY